VRRTFVRRSRKPAENADQGKKDHFRTDTKLRKYRFDMDKGLNPEKPEITNNKHHLILKLGQINSKLQYPNLKKDRKPIVWNFEFRSL
jgi:hypothetical protein